MNTQQIKPKKIEKRQSIHTLSGSHEVHRFCLKSEGEGEADVVHGGTSEYALNANARGKYAKDRSHAE